MSVISKLRVLAIASALVVGCADPAAPDSTTTNAAALDQLAPADAPASLLVLAPSADAAARAALERTVATLGGRVFATLPPRLVTAYLPAGADPVLADLGVVARFDRATTDGDLPDATVAERRFLEVHASRWFPAEAGEPIVPRARRRLAAETEAPARVRPDVARLADPGGDDQVAVPYASGTIAVAIVLPESTGAIDPSTEDWSEAMIRETYLKVAAALDRLAAADPNADLRFVLELASAPAPGGLDGTVATAYEFGQRAQWGSTTEFLATADVLAPLVGRPVPEAEAWSAAVEYTTALKRRHAADGAFFVIVAANGNYTAGLRAHAYINGPWTVLDTGYGHETFAHEFGHIFGALDEYCPDACVPPTALAGYLGMYNANAQSQPGGTGIDDGRGESASSLMIYNEPGAINGYTRAAWGWLDSDGDGVIDVRDTAPASELRAVVERQRVRLLGTVVDRPASRLFAAPYTVNRIVGLTYAFAPDGPWFPIAIASGERGRAAIDVDLGDLAPRATTLYVRAINSVGNVEPTPQALTIAPRGTANTAPHLRLELPARAGDADAATLVTTAVDLEGDPVTVRYDLDGDGAWDTGYGPVGPRRFTPRAGLRVVRAQARDGRGRTRIATATVPVVAGPTPPTVAVGALPSVVHGANPAALTTTVAVSPGATVTARAEVATNDEPQAVPVALDDAGRLTVALPTPTGLRTQPIDLTAGDRELGRHDLRDVLALGDELIAVAAGAGGLWVVDVADRASPVVVARLGLETTANRLYRAGDRLYVLGSYLAIVDVSDPRAPRELRQWRAVTDRATARAEDEVAISDGDGGYAPHFLATSLGGKIVRAEVAVTLDHPRPADLRIVLRGLKGGPASELVLWDRQPARGGLRTLRFTSSDTPALRLLDGTLAEGAWQLEVIDLVADGQGGRLVASALALSTRSFAAPAGAEPAELAGLTAGGALIVAGRAVTALDVSFAPWVTTLGTLAATGVATASVTGDVAIVTADLEGKNPDGTPSTAPVRGLCAIDFARPSWPRIVRCDTGLGPIRHHVTVAGRLYARTAPPCEKGETCAPPVTLVGSVGRFARGSTWPLATTPLAVDRFAIGDARALWTVNELGSIDQLDVTDPTAVRLAVRHARTYTVRLVPLGGGDLLLFDYGAVARRGRFDDAWSITSRVYRVTVTATAAGVATTATRLIHVVPYDHAPAPPVVALEAGEPTAPGPRLAITVTDPDDGTSWDPFRFARVDFDGDGAFDTDWQWMSVGRDGATTTVDLPAATGPRTATVEVRDGFWATATTTVLVP
jgi:subtilisin-like proprotein convertase family protein